VHLGVDRAPARTGAKVTNRKYICNKGDDCGVPEYIKDVKKVRIYGDQRILANDSDHHHGCRFNRARRTALSSHHTNPEKEQT
jgi:hypothetical protein